MAFACTLGNAQNNRGIIFLSGQQDGFGPLQVVDVEVTHCVVTRFCFVQHFFCETNIIKILLILKSDSSSGIWEKLFSFAFIINNSGRKINRFSFLPFRS